MITVYSDSTVCYVWLRVPARAHVYAPIYPGSCSCLQFHNYTTVRCCVVVVTAPLVTRARGYTTPVLRLRTRAADRCRLRITGLTHFLRCDFTPTGSCDAYLFLRSPPHQFAVTTRTLDYRLQPGLPDRSRLRGSLDSTRVYLRGFYRIPHVYAYRVVCSSYV